MQKKRVRRELLVSGDTLGIDNHRQIGRRAPQEHKEPATCGIMRHGCAAPQPRPYLLSNLAWQINEIALATIDAPTRHWVDGLSEQGLQTLELRSLHVVRTIRHLVTGRDVSGETSLRPRCLRSDFDRSTPDGFIGADS